MVQLEEFPGGLRGGEGVGEEVNLCLGVVVTGCCVGVAVYRSVLEVFVSIS